MATPSRFPNGIGTVPKNNPLGMYGLPDPTEWHTFFDDFDRYNAANMTIVLVGTGTVALANEDGGALTISTTAGATDSVLLQNAAGTFSVLPGRRSFFKSRFRISSLSAKETVGLCDSTTPSIGIYLTATPSANTLTINCQKSGTANPNLTVTVPLQLAVGAYASFAWDYDGKDEITFYVNDLVAGSLTVAPSDLPTVLLRPTASITNSAAGAKVMTLDYLFASSER